LGRSLGRNQEEADVEGGEVGQDGRLLMDLVPPFLELREGVVVDAMVLADFRSALSWVS
jgi:hypothetical protein